jgi:hypothetical protein
MANIGQVTTPNPRAKLCNRNVYPVFARKKSQLFDLLEIPRVISTTKTQKNFVAPQPIIIIDTYTFIINQTQSL